MSQKEQEDLRKEIEELGHEGVYNLMIEKGWSPESARMLAESLTIGDKNNENPIN